MEKHQTGFVSKFFSFANSNRLFECSNIVIGLSGGPDSVALLKVLCELRDKDNFFPKLYAVHVNHGLRGENANSDEEFCVTLCKANNISLKVFRFDIEALSKEQHKSIEEMGRIKRYECFNEVCDSLGNCRIALAHHRDDVAETMLMNLFRGSGLEGLTSPKALSGNLIRPLLCVTKSEIVDYLDLSNAGYCIDSTNFISDTTRNKWRNEIIPLISEVSTKKPSDALLDAYELLSSDLELIESVVTDKYDELLWKSGCSLFLNTRDFTELRYSLKSRLVRRLWLDTFGNLTDFAKIHVDLVLDFIESENKGTGTLDMPFGRKCFKNNGLIGFCNEGEEALIADSYTKGFGYVLLPEGTNQTVYVAKTTKMPNSSLNIDSVIVENNGVLEYNNLSWYHPVEGDLTDFNISIRNCLTSMSFRRAGSGISKSISKVLSDSHIPRDSRNRVAGIFVNDQLLWVPGIGHADGFLSEASFVLWKKANPNFKGNFLRLEFVKGST